MSSPTQAEPTRYLIQIVTGLPPKVDGVGDYALVIARALRKQHGIVTTFVVGNPDWSGHKSVDGFQVVRVERKTAHSLVLALLAASNQSDEKSVPPVLLHCSLYGYAKRALAFWLVRGLREWKRDFPQAQLITMFHELAADGPIWSSPFWIHGIQTRLIKCLQKESLISITSNSRYRRELTAFSDNKIKDVDVLPVLSTVGEPASSEFAKHRLPQLIIFGQSPARSAIFTKHISLLRRLCTSLCLQRIIEIGPGSRVSNLELPVPVDSRGVLDASQVSDILRQSLYGFIASDIGRLAKSTVFAAFCAHGVVPIVSGVGSAEEDGLFPNEQYVRLSDQQHFASAAQISVIAGKAYAWYANHTLNLQASHYQRLINRVYNV